MKFPSLKNLDEGAANTIKRYPFEILFEVGNMNFRLLKNKKPEVTSVTFMYLIKKK